MNNKEDFLLIKLYLENIYNNIDVEKNIKLFQNVVWDESKDFPEYLLELAYDLDFYDPYALDENVCGLADRNGFYSYNTIKKMVFEVLKIMKKE